MGLGETVEQSEAGGITPLEISEPNESIIHLTLHVKPTYISATKDSKVEVKLTVVDDFTKSKLVILEELLQESRERTECFQNYHSVAMQKNEDLTKSLEFCNSQLQDCMHRVEAITLRMDPFIDEKNQLENELMRAKEENQELKQELDTWKENVSKMRDAIIAQLSLDNFPNCAGDQEIE